MHSDKQEKLYWKRCELKAIPQALFRFSRSILITIKSIQLHYWVRSSTSITKLHVATNNDLPFQFDPIFGDTKQFVQAYEDIYGIKPDDYAAFGALTGEILQHGLTVSLHLRTF